MVRRIVAERHRYKEPDTVELSVSPIQRYKPAADGGYRTLLRGTGQALVTVGVVIVLYVVYQVWVTDAVNHLRQNQLAAELNAKWEGGTDPLFGGPGVVLPEIPIGTAIALIRIPALGSDYVRVIVEGTTQAALAAGPGHYVGSELPGVVGNFAVAGHRSGNGSPFDDLDKLRAGDAIVIETRDSYFVYRVIGDRGTGDPTVPDDEGMPGRQIVDASQIEVVSPVPGKPESTPHRKLLTLTTCEEYYFTLDRMIIHAELDGQPFPKSAGVPSVLR